MIHFSQKRDIKSCYTKFYAFVMVVDILKIVSQVSGLTILIFISLLLQDLYLSKNKIHPRILGEKTPEIFIGRLQDSWGFSQAVAWRLESSNQQHYTVSRVLKVYFIKVFHIKIFSFQGNPKNWVVSRVLISMGRKLIFILS